jgi:leucyl aminopeptidase (aminopeptidase T)
MVKYRAGTLERSMSSRSSADDLYRKVARKILVESLSVKKGESVTVETWNNGLPFARQVVLEARKMGAIPLTIFEDEDTYVEGVHKTPKDVLGKMGKQEYKLLSGTDAYVFIPGPVLGNFSHRLARGEQLDSTAYGESWYKAASKARLRGVRMAFGYLGEETQAILGKSVEVVATHQLKAALADYKSIRKTAKKLSSELADGSRGTVKTPGSKLTFQLAGKIEVEDGIVDEGDVGSENNICYIPPGYVYSEIDPESVSGSFTFSPTITRFGLIKDGTLEFRDGQLVAWRSKSSSAALGKITAAAAEKSRRATALLVGLNPLLGYGYGLNANSAGVVGIRVLGVNFTTNRASLSVAGATLVAHGHL